MVEDTSSISIRQRKKNGDNRLDLNQTKTQPQKIQRLQWLEHVKQMRKSRLSVESLVSRTKNNIRQRRRWTDNVRGSTSEMK